jgi:hypothetical protein
MKIFHRILIVSLLVVLFGGASARAASVGYAYCGTYGGYVMMYKSSEQIEELGKLRCGEKVEILTRWVEIVQVRTADGRVGWVRPTDITATPVAGGPTTSFGLTDASGAAQKPAVAPLTNDSILKLRGMRLSPDVIIAKIKSSPCEFDTTPAALQKLKLAGISDKIILAMVEAPSASAPPPAPKTPPVVEVKIPDGTQVDVEMSYSVNSDDSREGNIVLLSVVHDVAVNGAVVFKRGAEAHGRVLTVKESGLLGHPGELTCSMEDITAVTGDKIPASFPSQDPSHSVGTIKGDAGSSSKFKKGKAAVIAAGQRFQAIVNGDAMVKVPLSAAGATQAVAAANGTSKP